ncbi:Beta-galactosidase 3 [Hibiscus syriacus]|uniref:beta-galactosidase n=1 Tax=Hibiscus syriacus TaxID=106335 RepID=A0A6A3B169_HIBSY|nr:Beta-galactosidase 3 [Hibiscus syriacus]
MVTRVAANYGCAGLVFRIIKTRFKTFGARDPHRWSGGPFITTSYDYEAPIVELPGLPKWGHLKELHRAIKLSEHALLKSEPTTLSLGPSLEADVYDDGSGVCAAFLSNMDDKTDMNIVFRNVSYHLPAWSVSILPDCKNVAFTTAKVGSQASVIEMVPEELQPSVASPSKGLKGLIWDIFVENAGIWGVSDFTKNGFVDHINTTKETTDYLWNTTSIIIGEDEEFLKKANHPVLIESKGRALHAFVNQELQGSASGNGSHSPFNSGHTRLLWIHHQGMNQLAKGLAWLNGEEIGRYWPIESSKHEKCVYECGCRGKFFPDKCLTGCGEPSQRWNICQIVQFKPSGNNLVIFEEKGGDPTKITFSKRKTSSLCSHIAEDFPMVDQKLVPKVGSGKSGAQLKCPKNISISRVKFASFGNPTGRCGFCWGINK